MKFAIIQNKPVAHDVYRMDLAGNVDVLPAGGFVEIAVPGCYLRRPFSICESGNGRFSVVYKKVGHGTDLMTMLEEGDFLDILVNLGHGFDVAKTRQSALLIGGGLGVAPLFQLAKTLKGSGKRVVLCAGFNSVDDIFLKKEFENICDEVRWVTFDGSFGAKGLVTSQLSDIEYDYLYSCGPLPMLKAVAEHTRTSGQLSLEARMGCGFGICMGCTIATVNGPKRVCKEGPVFEKEELIW